MLTTCLPCSTDAERQKLSNQFQLVLNTIPHFKEDFPLLAVDDETLGLLITYVLHSFLTADIYSNLCDVKLSDASAHARGDDIRKLRDGILVLVEQSVGGKVAPSKSNRGWRDDVAGHLLCPRRLRDEYDADPKKYISALHTLADVLNALQVSA